MKLTIILALAFFCITVVSCEKECHRARKTLDPVDLHTLRPNGLFKSEGNSFKYTFTSDSTAIITYTIKDTTYEITYKVQTTGSTIYNQQKWNLK